MPLSTKPAALIIRNRSARAQATPAATSPKTEPAAQTNRPQKSQSLLSPLPSIQPPSIQRTSPPMNPATGDAIETKPQHGRDPGIAEYPPGTADQPPTRTAPVMIT